MKCQHKDCDKEAEKYELDNFEENKTELFYYCEEHAGDNGFCWMCGGFWGGVESFDFSKIKGICENCICEFEEPNYEEEMYNP